MSNPEVQSSLRKGGGQPNPTPSGEISGRLEQIRHSLPGDVDLKAFHAQAARRARAMGMEDKEIPSYSSARLYHFDRTPTVHYLAAVAEEYGVRLEWLITGDGVETKAEAALVTDEDRAKLGVGLLRQQLDYLGDLPLVVSAALVHHLTRRDAARWRDPEGKILAEHDDATEAWDHVLAPFEGERPLPGPDFTEYALAAIHALNLALNVKTIEQEESNG